MEKIEIAIEMKRDGRCIQTVVRSIREGLEKELLSGDDVGDEERVSLELQLVTEFLSFTDFPRLRAMRPRLAGTVDGRFVLRRGPGGEAVVEEAGGADQISP